MKTKILLAGVIATTLLFSFVAMEASAKSIKHLKAPDDAADCYTCHQKVTPRVAQNWYESKHGMALMKCFVCHGQPDGKGSIPFAVVPDAGTVCRKCHEPAMKRMVNKFGIKPDCYTCHPFHVNSLHHEAYKKSESKN
jgi:hypothetical protein